LDGAGGYQDSAETEAPRQEDKCVLTLYHIPHTMEMKHEPDSHRCAAGASARPVAPAGWSWSTAGAGIAPGSYPTARPHAIDHCPEENVCHALYRGT
jgi:hypothetical protein